MKTPAKFKRGFEGMRSQYDFSGGVRGKHARAYAKGTNRVTLDPDVAAFFPDGRSVNEALRKLTELARKNVQPKKPRRRKAG
jgi:hypothetical protein